ncbi:MAG: DUF86 domain-containing protein [Phycisphaerae bacterium]|nr:DUF86 domain-containing protein [Phycisphaerae bacterium]
MPLEENDAGYLWDMLEAARGVVASIRNLTLVQYQADDNLRLATERRIEIIGEAAGRVSQAVREDHPEIPWRQIIAQRHVLAHEYGEIDNELILSVATAHIPQLIGMLENMVPPAPPDVD